MLDENIQLINKRVGAQQFSDSPMNTTKTCSQSERYQFSAQQLQLQIVWKLTNGYNKRAMQTTMMLQRWTSYLRDYEYLTYFTILNEMKIKMIINLALAVPTMSTSWSKAEQPSHLLRHAYRTVRICWLNQTFGWTSL